MLTTIRSKRHTKEHYTWLIETLLNGLKEHASFEEKYPGIAAPVEMQTIRDEMERALLEGMRPVLFRTS